MGLRARPDERLRRFASDAQCARQGDLRPQDKATQGLHALRLFQAAI
jgi:hypothetical protein